MPTSGNKVNTQSLTMVWQTKYGLTQIPLIVVTASKEDTQKRRRMAKASNKYRQRNRQRN